MDALDEAVERLAEAAELVLGVDGQAPGQVAFALGDVLHGAAHDVQRFHQDADQ
ncbi:hypothetical protein D3C76_1881370 [compost metagenome]